MTVRASAAALAALAILVTACTPAKLAEGRVRSALLDAGLSEPNAACMAERMTDRLTLGQLRKLQALQSPKRSIADYVMTVRRVGDRELIEVTVGSALLCASGLAPERKPG
ncbi:MAG: hypothetical protein KGQ75_05510 [Sphingomonadales bacterium]|jgi:hypothetical protein|uniref:hypothetical protein n=1 Tax=Novosphingobium sp. NDB2Meth1 TaxID=1892847 RepID=UPI000930CB0A|nr:hypothetical protein [Novosphingobium sp. NDB2Meth1]MBU6394012.1 hypothetical protein [Sphingomonadales bacterium]MBY0392298.1 hypothetical protein [Novosphingobium sp.]